MTRIDVPESELKAQLERIETYLTTKLLPFWQEAGLSALAPGVTLPCPHPSNPPRRAAAGEAPLCAWDILTFLRM